MKSNYLFTTLVAISALITLPCAGQEQGVSGAPIYFPGESQPNVVTMTASRSEWPRANNTMNYNLYAATHEWKGGGYHRSAPAKWTNERAATEFNSAPTSCLDGPGNANPVSKFPVVIATGEKYQPEQDIYSGSEYGLDLKRTYRSFDTQASMFGAKWRSGYDYGFKAVGCNHVQGPFVSQCVPDRVTLTFPDGSTLPYDRNTEFTFKVHGSARDGVMTFTPYRGYTLVRNKLLYSYSTTGVLYKIESSGALVLSFHYDQNTGKLAKVINGVQQNISFVWSNNRVVQVTDPAGSTWGYGYNDRGMLISVTSPGANADIRTYHYEDSADATLLTGISFNGTRYSTYKYYPNRRVQESGLAGGEERDTFSYSANETTITDAKGQVTAYTFTPIQGGLKLAKVSRAGSSTCSAAVANTVYDTNGWVDYTLDWKGVKNDYSYSSNGRLMQLTTAAGTSAALTEVYTWTDENLSSVTFKDAKNVEYLKTEYSYFNSGFSRGELSSVTTTELATGQARSSTNKYTYQTSGVLESKTISTSDGAATMMTYDSLGNIKTVSNAFGHQIHYSEYNGLGFPRRMVDANNIETAYEYDEKGNLVSAVWQLPTGNLVTSFVYNSRRQITDITYSGGWAERARYDAAGRLVAIGNVRNEFLNLTFDINTRMFRTSSPRMVAATSGGSLTASVSGQFSSSIEVDSLGRPYATRGNAGQVINTRYDNNGNVESITDANGRVTRYTYDEQNRPLSITGADGGKTVMAYDSAGQLSSVRDPRGLTTSYIYNAFGDRVKTLSPDSGSTTYTYNSKGQLHTATFQDGKVVTYLWDTLGRLIAKSSGNFTDNYIYDEGLYGTGRLSRVHDRSGEVAYTYGPRGELLNQKNVVFGKVFNTTWTYDSLGRPEGMTYPSGLMLRYVYDGTGRLTAVKSNGSR